MEYLALVVACLFFGSFLFSLVMGGSDEVQRLMQDDPARCCLGVLFFAVVAFVAMTVLGLVFGLGK